MNGKNMIKKQNRINDKFMLKLAEIEKNLYLLTPLELEYWNMIKAGKKNALFLISRPGEAKTAILETIGNKLNLNIIDRRISQVDESVLGLMPIVDRFTNIFRRTKVFDYGVPRWAVIANRRPTLVIFDEFNRGGLAQKNACLQLICERRIGDNFKFNDMVFFSATGNLGTEDNTDVEEMDEAHKARFIIHKHKVSYNDWKIGYADEHVHPLILEFLDSDEGKLYPTATNENYNGRANHRSWSNLSDLMYVNFGKKVIEKDRFFKFLNIFGKKKIVVDRLLEDYDMEVLHTFLVNNGVNYIGATAIDFATHLKMMREINAGLIFKDYQNVKKFVKAENRVLISKLLHQLIQSDIESKNESEIKNYIDFLHDIKSYTDENGKVHDNDEFIGHIYTILKSMKVDDTTNYKNTKKVLTSFNEVLDDLRKIQDPKGRAKNVEEDVKVINENLQKTIEESIPQNTEVELENVEDEKN